MHSPGVPHCETSCRFAIALAAERKINLVWFLSLQPKNDRSVVGRSGLRSRNLVDLATLQSGGELRREQKVIDADSTVVLKRLAEVVPECELAALPRMQRTEGINVAQAEISPIPLPRFRLEKRIVHPG